MKAKMGAAATPVQSALKSYNKLSFEIIRIYIMDSIMLIHTRGKVISKIYVHIIIVILLKFI